MPKVERERVGFCRMCGKDVPWGTDYCPACAPLHEQLPDRCGKVAIGLVGVGFTMVLVSLCTAVSSPNRFPLLVLLLGIALVFGGCISGLIGIIVSRSRAEKNLSLIALLIGFLGIYGLIHLPVVWAMLYSLGI